MRPSRLILLLATGVALTASIGACSKDDSSSAGTRVDVTAGDDSCEVSTSSVAAGPSTFTVENTGSDVTEVYVYGQDGDAFTKIMGEAENIGPGTSRDFSVKLNPGDYQVACKPGMVGDGIRTDLTVTGESDPANGAGESAYDRELEVKVDSNGKVALPSELSAQVGEKIEFKLENDSPDEYYLELLGPSGDGLGEAEAAASADAEFIAELSKAGDYTLKAYADGGEDSAQTQTMTVSAAG